jgi:hypothetical protein
MDQQQFVKILDGWFTSSYLIFFFVFHSSQLLSYGRRIPLHELNARIDVSID